MAQSILQRESSETDLSATGNRSESEIDKSTETIGETFNRENEELIRCLLILQEEATKQTQSPSQSFFSRISSTLKRPTTISVPLPIDESEHHSTILHTSSVDFPPTRRQPFFNVARVSLPRSPHQESYAKMSHEEDDDEDSFHTPSISHMPEMKTPPHQQQTNMYSIDEDTHPSANEGGTEMILTAATLTPLIMPCSSPFSAAAATTQNETATVSSTSTPTSRC